SPPRGAGATIPAIVMWHVASVRPFDRGRPPVSGRFKTIAAPLSSAVSNLSRPERRHLVRRDCPRPRSYPCRCGVIDRIRALAITSAKRSGLASDIAPAAESGMPGVMVRRVGPRAWPLVLPSTRTRDRVEDGGHADLRVEPAAETPQKFARFIATEVTRNGELLRSANFAPTYAP